MPVYAGYTKDLSTEQREMNRAIALVSIERDRIEHERQLHAEIAVVLDAVGYELQAKTIVLVEGG